MDMNVSTIDGACHCGTVRFRVRLTNGLHTARRCTCSYCRMRGAVAVSADLGGVDILSGAEALSLYKFNSETAKHFFCSKCGIHTHHQRRSNPNQYGVNVCLPVRFKSLRFRGCCRVRWRQSPCGRLFFEAQGRRPSEIHYRAGGS